MKRIYSLSMTAEYIVKLVNLKHVGVYNVNKVSNAINILQQHFSSKFVTK